MLEQLSASGALGRPLAGRNRLNVAAIPVLENRRLGDPKSPAAGAAESVGDEIASANSVANMRFGDSKNRGHFRDLETVGIRERFPLLDSVLRRRDYTRVPGFTVAHGKTPFDPNRDDGCVTRAVGGVPPQRGVQFTEGNWTEATSRAPFFLWAATHSFSGLL
jgi:hypothetical protein